MQRLLFLICLASASLCAQSPDSTKTFNRLQVGVVYGQMDHEVDFTPSQDVEPLRGTEIGLALRYFDKQLVGFQAEVSLQNAGWREDLGDTLETRYQREYQFVELQVLTQFSIGQGAIQPLIQAGPYLSIPLSNEETIPEGFDPGDDEIPVIYGFDIPFRPNYGLRIGAGLNVELGPVTLQLEARYLLGFSDLVKTGTTQTVISRRAGIGGHVGVFYQLW